MKILNDKEKEIKKLDLGIVKAGKSKNFVFYLFNDSTANINNLKVEISEKEIEIITAPTELKPESKEKFEISWKPSLNLRKGLKTSLKITGVELFSG